MKDHCAADSEAGNRDQSQGFSDRRTEAEAIGEKRRQRERDSQKIEPHWGMNRAIGFSSWQTQLQQNCRQADCAHNHDG